MESEPKDAQLVRAVVTLLVRHPESVEVNRTIDDLGVLLTLRVHAEDMAGIVGREGRTAKAIRTLLRVIGAQNDERVNLKIVEPHGAEDRTEAAPREESAADVSQEPVDPSIASKTSDRSYFDFDDIPEPLA